MVDSYLLPASKSRVTKTTTKIKNPAPISFRYCPPPHLRIRGYLPAPIINGGGDDLWKWPHFRELNLDLGSGHTAYCHASLVDLYLHTKFHWNQRNFLWTDIRMDVRTGGWTLETHFIRSTWRSRLKNPAPISCRYCSLFKNPWSFISPHYKWGRR